MDTTGLLNGRLHHKGCVATSLDAVILLFGSAIAGSLQRMRLKVTLKDDDNNNNNNNNNNSSITR